MASAGVRAAPGSPAYRLEGCRGARGRPARCWRQQDAMAAPRRSRSFRPWGEEWPAACRSPRKDLLRWQRLALCLCPMLVVGVLYGAPPPGSSSTQTYCLACSTSAAAASHCACIALKEVPSTSERLMVSSHSRVINPVVRNWDAAGVGRSYGKLRTGTRQRYCSLLTTPRTMSRFKCSHVCYVLESSEYECLPIPGSSCFNILQPQIGPACRPRRGVSTSCTLTLTLIILTRLDLSLNAIPPLDDQYTIELSAAGRVSTSGSASSLQEAHAAPGVDSGTVQGNHHFPWEEAMQTMTFCTESCDASRNGRCDDGRNSNGRQVMVGDWLAI